MGPVLIEQKGVIKRLVLRRSRTIVYLLSKIEALYLAIKPDYSSSSSPPIIQPSDAKNMNFRYKISPHLTLILSFPHSGSTNLGKVQTTTATNGLIMDPL